MKHLPTEILGEIFIHLEQDEKLECMLVCHRWKQTIEDFALYRSICIYKPTHLKTLQSKLEENPNIAVKLEHLVLSFNHAKYAVYLRNLLPLICNLRVLVCSSDEYETIPIEVGTQYPWHNTIEHIFEDARYGTSYQLLSTSMCPFLTTLTVVNRWGNAIVPFLTNAPALKHLSMHDLELHFDDLEFIHNSLLYLESLKLTGVDILKSDFHDDITPAPSVRELFFDLNTVALERNRIDLLAYISNKHPNLYKLSYHIDQFLVTVEELETMYELGWTPLLKKLGFQLKKLYTDNSGFGNDLFVTLNRFSYNLDVLEVNCLPEKALSNLAASSHPFHFIHTLFLQNTKITSYTWLKKLSVLKKLKIYYYFPRKTIKIDQLLKNAPTTLESLTLLNGALVFDQTYEGVAYIKTLSFTKVTLPRKVDSFINQHFPKLSKLKLKQCDFLENALRLPTINLTHFHFTGILGHNQKSNFILISDSNGIQLFHLQGPGYRRLSEETCKSLYYMNYPPIKSRLLGGNNKISDFTLHCNSIDNIVLS